MGRTLGIDVGTNSLGWAIVEKDEEKIQLLDKGVHIFQEGVKYEKGSEQSRAAERTEYRSARRLIRRRRVRKIELLKKLIEYNYCPSLKPEDIKNWRDKKKYPLQEAFLQWQRTDDNENKNPYYYRHLTVNQKLDLNTEADRFILGRALYHLVQRRGFKSNRLENTKESEGEIKKSITTLSEEIQKAGFRYLGEYFYHCYLHKIKIRKRYTAREEHYLTEFRAICRKQELTDKQAKELENAIFSQRPLKSQKGGVGKCVFEKNKKRCPISHPRYEEYRMLCFLNNIRIKKPFDTEMRPLNGDERKLVQPLFFRKSKSTFDFEDIAKKLAPKKQYKHYKEKNFPESDTLFNYRMNTTVNGCPTTAEFLSLWGENWREELYARYRNKDNKNGSKNTEEVVNDIWHVLFTFDSDEKLIGFGQEKIGLTEQDAQEFAKIHLKQDYAALSLKAIDKILPWLRKGLIYSHAVFLANIDNIIPPSEWEHPGRQSTICSDIQQIIEGEQEQKDFVRIVNNLVRVCLDNHYSWEDTPIQTDSFRKECDEKIETYYGKKRWNEFPEITRQKIRNEVFECFSIQMHKNLNRGEFIKPQRIDDRVGEYLTTHCNTKPGDIKNLYHPSDIEIYKRPEISENGKRYLGSPRIAAVKNPMAMRSLFRLRKVVNELLATNRIDEDTKIHIELSRDLNDSNKRLALQRWQKNRENEHKIYQEEIQKLYKAECRHDIIPTDNEILKYQLWKEQDGLCLYTGEKISICNFIGAGSMYDIEHTIPLSRSYDNSQMNVTLCNNVFNRDIKRNKIPSELSNHEEILLRTEQWEKRYKELEIQIEFWRKRGKNALTKESKDSAIQRRHFLQAERDYWKGKYERFTMQNVPDGFKNSQLVDNGIISKYALQYLKTVFNKVYAVKGTAVAEYRKTWGIQEEYTKKIRSNHVHHCIDAITMACMTKKNYEELAHLFYENESWKQQRGGKPLPFPKPWKNFTEDIINIHKEILVSHYTPDVLPKQSRKVERKKGKIVRNIEGQPLIAQGDTIRGALHMETNYGAIKRVFTDTQGQKEEKICYVVRKPIDSLSPADVKNIVDDTVREKIQAVLDRKGTLKDGIWMNEEKQIPIKSVRCYVPTVTSPIKLKQHRDLSTQEHKQYNYVANDSNYLMAIYESTDEKGKTKRSFELINNLEAGQYFKRSNINRHTLDIVPPVIKKGKQILTQKALLKTGTMVLFYQYNPDEIWELEAETLSKRLYKCTTMSKDGRIVFKYHQEARSDENLKNDYEEQHQKKAPSSLRKGESHVNFEKPFPKLVLSPSSFNMLVEGYDFRISVLGEIKPI